MSNGEDRFSVSGPLFEPKRLKRKARAEGRYLIPPSVEIREDEVEVMSTEEAGRNFDEGAAKDASQTLISPKDAPEISEEELPPPVAEEDIPDEDVPEEERYPEAEEDNEEQKEEPKLAPPSPVRKDWRPYSPLSDQITGAPFLSQASPGAGAQGQANPANFLLLLAGVVVIGAIIYFLKRR